MPRPLTPCEEYGHDYEDIASYPVGPDGETATWRVCSDCCDGYESVEE